MHHLNLSMASGRVHALSLCNAAPSKANNPLLAAGRRGHRLHLPHAVSTRQACKIFGNLPVPASDPWQALDGLQTALQRDRLLMIVLSA